MPTPPPAAAANPPGVTGDMPMRPGTVIAGNLTDKERRELQEAGIDPNGPLPQNVAQLLQQAKLEAQAESRNNLPPPVSPDTPPVEFNPIDIDQNDPQAMAEFSRKVKEVTVAQEAAKERAEMQEEVGVGTPPTTNPADIRPAPPQPEPAVPQQKSRAQQLVEAQKQAEQQNKEFEQRYAGMDDTVAKAAQVADGVIPPDHEIEVENDLADAIVSPSAEEPSRTGATLELKDCPHCGWDLAIDDPVEPDDFMKQQFLAAVLGRQTFKHVFELFGGSLKVTLRTLTTREVDQIYQQAFYETQNDVLKTQDDFYERVNRLRLFLQVCMLEGPKGVIADLPDGLTKETNPTAEAHYSGTVLEGQTLLPNIERYLLDEVLTTEVLVRAIGNVCSGFNRLIAKMEAMIDNPDFWQATDSSP
jgi:hypothetical protein